MPSVGTAYVNIRINTKSFTTQLTTVMEGLSKKMEAAGKSMGKDFEKGLKQTNFDTAFKPLTDASDKAKTKVVNNNLAMERSAGRAGKNISDGLAAGGDGANRLAADIKRARTEVGGLGQDASRAKRSLSGIGSGSGNSLRKAGNDAGFFSNMLRDLTSSADGNAAMLRGLYQTAAFGGTALAGLVGALSGAAQGIFAIGANAASATPALAILANGLLSLAQVGGVLAIAMKGVGAAISAGLKATAPPAKALAKNTDGIAKAVKAALRAVRDAKEGLADAYRAAARAAEDAARRTAEAEQNLASAQREVTVAQRNLNSARAEGLEQLEDIAFAAEDAALAEQRASLDLEDAYGRLLAVSELAPDNRARVEAELAFKEAELHLREAKDHREDADKDQKQAAKSGVEGTEAVLTARNALADAQQREADAAKELADARRNEAEVAEDNARRIRDALERVADAQDRLKDAHKGTGKAATEAAKAHDAYADALAKLTPAQREFVEKLISMRAQFKAIKLAVTEPLFKALTASLDTLNKKGKDAKSFFDIIRIGLAGTSEVLAGTVTKLADLAASDAFQGHLANAMKFNNQAMGNFGIALRNIISAFVRLADAAGPVFVRFSEWVATVTKVDSSTGKMRGTIEKAENTVHRWWNLLKQVTRTIRIWGSAGNTAINRFNDRKGYIPTLTQNLKKFNDRMQGTEASKDLVERFDQALKNLNATGGALKTVLQPLIDLGSDPNVETALNIIADSPAFERLGDTASDALPDLALFATHILDIAATFSETGGMTHFLDILESVTKSISDMIETINDNTPFLKWIALLSAVSLAVRLLWGAVKIILSPLILMGRNVKNAGKNFDDFTSKQPGQAGKFSGAWKTAGGAFSRITTNIGRSISNVGTRFKNLGGRIGSLVTSNKFVPQAPKQKIQKEPAVKTDPKEQAKAAEAGESVSAAYARGLEAGTVQITAALNAMETKVKATLAAMKPRLVIEAETVGVQIMAGVTAGINTGTKGATTAAQRAGRKIIKAVKKGANVKSPPPEMIAMGVQIIEGGAIGIADGTPAAVLEAEAAGFKVSAGVAKGMASGKGLVTAAGASLVAAPVPAVGGAVPAAGKAAGGLTAVGAAAGGPVGKVGKLAGVFGKFGKVLGPVTKVLGPFAKVVGFILPKAFSALLGPIGMIALTVLPILWPLIVKLNDKFHIVEKTMNAVKFVLGKVADAFTWLWEHAIMPLFDWVKSHWPLLLAILTGPIGIAVLLIIKNFDRIVKFVKGVPKKIKNFLRGVWNILTTGLRIVWDKVQGIWRRVMAYIKGRPAQFRRNLAALWNIFSTGLHVVWGKVQSLWRTITTYIKGRPAQFKRNLAALWDIFKDGLAAAYNWVKDKFRNIKKDVSDWPRQIASGLRHLFDGMGKGLIAGINFVGDKVNFLINKLNGILKKFNAPEIKIKWPHLTFTGFKFAEGGPVRGPGGPKSDSIPAMLSNGEHVWTAAEVRAAGGHKNVAKMRKSTTGKGGFGDWAGNIAGNLVDAASNVGDALKHGFEFALKWVLSKFKDTLGEGDSFPKRLVLGVVNSVANKISGKGKKADEDVAAAQAASSSGSGPAAVWRALRSIGLTKIQTAGVMGNIQSESNFDPFIVQNDGRSMNPARAGSGGYGLVQWTPGRKLIPYLHGKKPSINTEITALSQQLRGRGRSPEGAAGRRLRAANTIFEATDAFLNGYERPQSRVISARLAQAVKWYRRFKGSDAISAAAAGGFGGAVSGGGWTYPLVAHFRITQSPNSGHNPNNAVDIGAPMRTKAVAAHSGTAFRKSAFGYGKYLDIVVKRDGTFVRYAHLHSYKVSSGQRVRVGQIVALTDSTGAHTSGPHLHFEYNPRGRQTGNTVTAMHRLGVRMAKGGVVTPTAAGTLALLAEAGKHERVTPLDREGFSPAERKMMEILEAKLDGSGGGGDTIHVHPAAQMNEAALADMVARRVAWKRRRGTGR